MFNANSSSTTTTTTTTSYNYNSINNTTTTTTTNKTTNNLNYKSSLNNTLSKATQFQQQHQQQTSPAPSRGNILPNKSSLFGTNGISSAAGPTATGSNNSLATATVTSTTTTPTNKSPTPSMKPVPNHGKPNFAPKPPGLQQLALASSQRTTVSRHHSMKSPRYTRSNKNNKNTVYLIKVTACNASNNFLKIQVYCFGARSWHLNSVQSKKKKCGLSTNRAAS